MLLLDTDVTPLPQCQQAVDSFERLSAGVREDLR
ncbi:hypothetical protein LCGC14_1731100, partial [marine sediment metagenome]